MTEVRTAADMLGSINSMFGTNKAKEKDGVVVKFGKLHIRIARMGGANEKFGALFEEAYRPYRLMEANGLTVPEKSQKEVLYRAVAEAVILEWGMEDDDGTYTEIPYKPEDAIKAFNDSEDFFAFVLEQSKSQKNFRDAVVATDAKN